MRSPAKRITIQHVEPNSPRSAPLDELCRRRTISCGDQGREKFNQISSQIAFGADVLRLIAGSGRSGTTWLLDALAEANGLRPVFEPLHTDTSSVGRKFGHAYLTRNSNCAELKAMLSAAAEGALNTIWTDYRMKPGRLRIGLKHFRSPAELRVLMHKWRELAHRYAAGRGKKTRCATIVKCIRANLMLDWIHSSIDARIVLLMRHPGAAVESRLRFAAHWDPFPLLKKYRNDTALMSGPINRQAARMNRAMTRTEALTAIWCIENLVPAAQAASNGYLVTFYEELLERPETEWPRVAQGLGLAEVPSATILHRPSQQAATRLHRGSAIGESYVKDYGSWNARLANDDLAQVDAILREFGVDFYTVAEARPNIEAFSLRFLEG
ncbi:MAG: hypothetical protein H0W33_00110 [Gammaproteobacteria bacterium]|nr:hypothetical protein [Gammaproteobacteria bacterium]